MKKAQKLAAGIAVSMMVSAISAPVSFAADKAFGIDEINWTSQDWNSIAMTNDDTVETGAVIRTSADPGSKAAGYLYRGAAAQVVEKGDEWTKISSGKVTGYVKNEFLAFGDHARGLAAHYGTQGIVANWNDVNVFSDNDAESRITAQLNDGAPMSMLEDNGHWITVQQGADSAGYVSEEDVTRVLLVDTAVPAEGEDIADVPSGMTAESVQAFVSEDAQGSDDSLTLSAASYEDSSYEESASYEETSGYEDTSSYSYEDTSSYDDASSYSYEDTSSYDDASSASYEDTSYDDGSSYEDTTYYDDGSASWEDTASSYTEESQTQTVSTQTVSDDAQIQALYDAYITAQNAAMDCTSEEDAQTKADAAINAWNAYLAACGESSSAASYDTAAQSSDTAAADSSYASYEEAEAQASQEAANAEYSEPAQAETPAEEYTSSSSGSSAYGNYSDVDLLAAIIWCEAGNQSYDGMVAVGQVVMNRVASPSFPNTISEVLNQPGQFTPASAGTLQAALASGVNSNCYAAAQDAMSGAAPVPGYPLYFNTHSGSYQLGAHYFS